MDTQWKRNINGFKKSMQRANTVTTMGGTGAQLVDRHSKGTMGVNVVPNMTTPGFTISSWMQHVLNSLPEYYSGMFTITPSQARRTLMIQIKMTFGGTTSKSRVDQVVSFEVDPMDDIENSISQIDTYIEEAFRVMNRKAHLKFGDYPNVRVWAMQHTGSIFPPNEKIPGWVWPKWNSKHPGMKAVIDGGLKDQDGEIMAPAKRAVKAVQGAIPRKEPKAPVCPKHETRMVFDKTENIWACPETDCKIIFRPKADDRPPGTVVLGKGNVSIKTDGTGTLLFVSDDNVALDISKYVTNAEFSNEMGNVVSSPMAAGQIVAPSGRVRVTLEIVGMNVVKIS